MPRIYKAHLNKISKILNYWKQSVELTLSETLHSRERTLIRLEIIVK